MAIQNCAFVGVCDYVHCTNHMCVYLVQHFPDSDKMRSHTESHVSVSCVSDSLLQWRWKGCLEDTTSLPYHCLPLTSVQALSHS